VLRISAPLAPPEEVQLMIRRQLVIPVSTEQLWDALTDPDQVQSWFGARVEWELRDGAPARFWGDDGVERHGRVDVVRPHRHLRFRWWPVARPNEHDGDESDEGGGTDRSALKVDDPSSDDPIRSARDDVALPEDAASEVSYVLEPDEGGTRLTVQERRLDSALRHDGSGGLPTASASANPFDCPPSRGADVPAWPWTAWDHRLAGMWITVLAPTPALARH
jgi:uncharacterized protein YndB with AHSA1/START domain